MWDGNHVRKIASANHGLIDRRKVKSLGLTNNQIATALKRRWWEQVHPGVYYVNATAMTWEAKLAGAVMAAGPDAGASHRAAARLRGLDVIRSELVEITVPYSDRPMPEGVAIHRTRRPRPLALHRSIPVTTVERTLLDLASVLSPRMLTRSIESALRLRLTTIAMMWRVIDTDGGRGVTGTRALRHALGQVELELTGSFAESDFNDLLKRAPVPDAQLQFRVLLPDGSNAYPDFAWPGLMKLVEVDGFMAHSTPEQLQNDLRRQNLLMELGWQVRRFSARDIRDRPMEVIGEIIRFLSP